LTKEDLAAFAAYHLSEESRPLDTFLTLLRRWQREQPENPLPLELSTRVKQFQPPGELDVLRLAPHRELIFRRAAEEPLLLRQYGRALMRQYSEQRSVFNAPPTDEIEPVLRRLIEVDPDHQRVYQAWLAELAWDREDDEQSLRWGELALAPDLPRGNARFRVDPEAALRAAAFVAELYLRRGEPARAAAFCEGVVQAGYLNDETRYNALLFEFTQRRVLLALSRAAE
jgi:rubrerythrin